MPVLLSVMTMALLHSSRPAEFLGLRKNLEGFFLGFWVAGNGADFGSASLFCYSGKASSQIPKAFKPHPAIRGLRISEALVGGLGRDCLSHSPGGQCAPGASHSVAARHGSYYCALKPQPCPSCESWATLRPNAEQPVRALCTLGCRCCVGTQRAPIVQGFRV